MRFLLIALVCIGCGDGAVAPSFDGGSTGGNSAMAGAGGAGSNDGTGGALATGGTAGGAAGASGTGGAAGATSAQCFIPLAQVSTNASAYISLAGLPAETQQTRAGCNAQYQVGTAVMVEIIDGQVTTGTFGSGWTETGYEIVPSGGSCSATITYQEDAGKCGTASLHATVTVPPQ